MCLGWGGGGGLILETLEAIIIDLIHLRYPIEGYLFVLRYIDSSFSWRAFVYVKQQYSGSFCAWHIAINQKKSNKTNKNKKKSHLFLVKQLFSGVCSGWLRRYTLISSRRSIEKVLKKKFEINFCWIISFGIEV